jgi:hypothetical protein
MLDEIAVMLLAGHEATERRSGVAVERAGSPQPSFPPRALSWCRTSLPHCANIVILAAFCATVSSPSTPLLMDAIGAHSGEPAEDAHADSEAIEDSAGALCWGGARRWTGSDVMLDKLPQARSFASLEREVAEERAMLGKAEATAAPGRETLGGLVAKYEELVVDREFAEKADVSAPSSLERARVQADRQQPYGAAFVRPTLPEGALYPRRIVASITGFAIALVLGALGVLIAYAIRDHAV